jgi:hypothetical protein
VSENIDPLKVTGLSEELLTAALGNTVQNVIESYNGKMDSIVEMVQNSVDALESRWSGWDFDGSAREGVDRHPYLKVVIDTDTDTVTVIDNGVGIDAREMQKVLTPNLSPKSLLGLGQRGHKGVGTTFLMYGHNRFNIETKHAAEDGSESHVAYQMTGARDAMHSGQLLPTLHLQGEGAWRSTISAFQSGTAVSVLLDGGSSYGRLGGTIRNSTELWVHLLRTYTALGELRLGSFHDRENWPPWQRVLRAEVELKRGASESAPVDFEFDLPHLSASADGELIASIDKIPRTPAVRTYHAIYESLDHVSLKHMFDDELDELRESSDGLAQQIVRRFDMLKPEIYGALSFENTWYDKFGRRRIGSPDTRNLPQSQLVNGGTIVASVGMPMGILNDNQDKKLQPQTRRRLFVAIGFNAKFRPDIGRQSVPAADRPLVGWLETVMRKRLETFDGWLIKSNADSTFRSNSIEQARETLTKKQEQIAKANSGPDVPGLPVSRRPHWEEELLAAFTSFVSSGRLTGYHLGALPGTSCMFDCLLSVELEQGQSVDAGIDGSKFTDGVHRLRNRWCEFKVELPDLLADFLKEDGDPAKKYFELLGLAVVWFVPDGLGEGFDIDVLAPVDARRNYPYSTHRVSRPGYDHVVEVIELRELVTTLPHHGLASDRA